MDKPRVLIVEDSPTMRERLRIVFEEAGCEVSEAGTGARTLELARRATPDLVLQDLLLPDINGFELGRQLRGLDGMGRVPMIAFSAYEDLLDEARGQDIGYDDYLLKPVEPEILVDHVRHLLPALPPTPAA